MTAIVAAMAETTVPRHESVATASLGEVQSPLFSLRHRSLPSRLAKFCRLCWRTWLHPKRRPWALFRHGASRPSAPHVLGTLKRK